MSTNATRQIRPTVNHRLSENDAYCRMEPPVQRSYHQDRDDDQREMPARPCPWARGRRPETTGRGAGCLPRRPCGRRPSSRRTRFRRMPRPARLKRLRRPPPMSSVFMPDARSASSRLSNPDFAILPPMPVPSARTEGSLRFRSICLPWECLFSQGRGTRPGFRRPSLPRRLQARFRAPRPRT